MTENVENTTTTSAKEDKLLRNLTDENVNHRVKVTELEKSKIALEAEVAKLKADHESVTKQLQETHTKAEARVIKAELRSIAREAGMVDMDFLNILDLSGVTIDGDEVKGAEEAIAKAKKNKPHFFKEASTSSTGSSPKAHEASGGVKAFADMSDSEKKAFEKKMGIKR